DVVVQDRALHHRAGVDDDAGGQHGPRDLAADEAAGADDGLTGDAARVEAGRGELVGVGVDGPLPVVEVEGGTLGDQVHVGVVVRVQGAHVTPVAAVPAGLAGH